MAQSEANDAAGGQSKKPEGHAAEGEGERVGAGYRNQADYGGQGVAGAEQGDPERLAEPKEGSGGSDGG